MTTLTLDADVARALLKIIEEDRQDVEDLVTIVVQKLLDKIDLPGPDNLIEPFIIQIAQRIAVYVYDLLFQLLQESAGDLLLTDESSSGPESSESS